MKKSTFTKEPIAFVLKLSERVARVSRRSAARWASAKPRSTLGARRLHSRCSGQIRPRAALATDYGYGRDTHHRCRSRSSSPLAFTHEAQGFKLDTRVSEAIGEPGTTVTGK